MATEPPARRIAQARMAWALLVSLLFALPALVACGHTAPPGAAPVTMSFCGSDPAVQPAAVEVVCFTTDITARNLAWQAWGKPTATAKGSAVVDLCSFEDCATGLYSTVPITLTVSKIERCGKNVRAYSVLRYAFPGGSPWAGLPSNLRTSSYQAASDQPLPPANQTVSLTCS